LGGGRQHGQGVEPKGVRDARAEELDFMMKLGVFDLVNRDVATMAGCKKPTTVKWIDIDKGTAEKPVVRSRLVARDFKGKDGGREDLFAATPPWEILKCVLVLARQTEGEKVMLIDVKKAHLNGKVNMEDDGRHFIELPLESKADGKVGELKRWLYGMRPAARAWEDDYSKNLEEIDMKRGSAAPTTFWCAGTGVRCVVHGDDFTFTGKGQELKRIKENMEKCTRSR
jgi:hypothetical protein